jgi:hypothetical protein
MHYDVLDQPGWRGAIERCIARQFIQRFLIMLIVVNAFNLGVEANHEVMQVICNELF